MRTMIFRQLGPAGIGNLFVARPAGDPDREHERADVMWATGAADESLTESDGCCGSKANVRCELQPHLVSVRDEGREGSNHG